MNVEQISKKQMCTTAVTIMFVFKLGPEENNEDPAKRE